MATALDTAPRQRIIALDALRGLAVLGIVLMNVYVYALPAPAYYNPLAWGGDGALDLWVWRLSFLFVEDKFRTLFALLFGAGVAILLSRRSGGGLRGHYARMLVLFVIGIAHAVLLANNDILRAYAMAGLVLPLFLPLAQRWLVVAALILLAVHLVAGLVWVGPALTGDASALASFEWGFGQSPALAGQVAEHARETLGARIERRFDTLLPTLLNVASSIPLNLATMLLGVFFWRSGLLAGKWRRVRSLELAVRCAIPAIAVLFALLVWVERSGFAGAEVAAASLIVSAPADLALGIAYAALAIETFRRSSSWLALALAGAGRLSLTAYLATSVILAGIFASWGLGWFGGVSRAGAFALALVPIIAILVFARPLLAMLGVGPAEWFWRFSSRLLGGQAR